MDAKQKDQTPSPANIEKTKDHTYSGENSVGNGDGGGVGGSREAWGGELPSPWEDEEQAETD